MTTYDFTVKRGTTFDGATFTILVNGVALDLTSASALCQFKSGGTVALELTVGTGITLVTPASGVLRLDPRVFAIAAGSYKYDILLTLASGAKRIYIEGTATITEAQSVAP